ncbi:MAG: hypothetical protein EXQ91_03890 [Alphaproteobacteria bacterium]|nr:hypothetical protein [Alphaproteobacteria bacterium]
MTESDVLHSAAIVGIRSRGVAIKPWSPVMMALFKKQLDGIFSEEAGRDANFKRTLSALTSFRSGYVAWRDIGAL